MTYSTQDPALHWYYIELRLNEIIMHITEEMSSKYELLLYLLTYPWVKDTDKSKCII